MYEYKKVTVFQNEQYIIDAHSDFGWDLYSCQHIHEGRTTVKGVNSKVSADKHNIYVDTKVNTEYRSDDYTILVFRRDTNMRYYQELKELELDFMARDGYNEYIER